MQVILKKEVKDLGKVGDLVNVANGFARNFLFPRDLAVVATEDKMKEFQHWQRMAVSRKKQDLSDKKVLVETLANLSIVFKATAGGETDKLFGSITTKDISDELEKMGHTVDKKDITLVEAIRMLGQHKAIIKFGEGVEGEITITVERKED